MPALNAPKLSLRLRLFLGTALIGLPLVVLAALVHVYLSQWIGDFDADLQRSAQQLDLSARSPERLLPPEAGTNRVSQRLGGSLAPDSQKRALRETSLQSLAQLQVAYQNDIRIQRDRLVELRRRIIGAIAAFGGMALLAYFLVNRRLLHALRAPLESVQTAMRHLAERDLAYRLPVHGTDEVGRFAQAFNQMADRLASQQSELEERSVRDGLTGLYNRREFEKRLQEECQRARRYRRTLALLMLDLDHFKQINDRYGHPMGDEVLMTVADLLRVNVRPADIVCRYGGEEMVVIMPETDRAGALVAAERIRMTIGLAEIAVPQDAALHVRVSVGLAVCPSDAQTPLDLLSAADRALYAAKRGGRDRVCIP